MMQVRAARASDHEAVSRIEAEVHDLHARGDPHCYRPTLSSELETNFAEALNRHFFLVIEDEAGVKGYAQCAIIGMKDDRFVNEQKILMIDAIAVAGSAIGKGYGRRLFEEVQARSRREGCTSIELNVWNFNERALGFYRAMGLEPIRVRMRKIL